MRKLIIVLSCFLVGFVSTPVNAAEITAEFDLSENASISSSENVVIVSRIDTDVKVYMDSSSQTLSLKYIGNKRGNHALSDGSIADIVSKKIGAEFKVFAIPNPDNQLPIRISSNKRIGLKGSSTNTVDNSSSVYLYDENDQPLGVVSKPIVTDLNGNIILSYFVFSSGSVQIQLEDSYVGVEPLIVVFSVLPQYTFTDFFYTTSGFITRPEGVSLSLKVNKNADGWYIHDSGTDLLDTSWSVVYNKYSPYGNWYNTDGLYKQYRCHLVYAWPIDTSWDIEPWRPNVSYADTVFAGCNPE